jgi:putative ABC transport system permease protein
MRGLLKIAYKLLVNDRGKFLALLIGITFAVFLMVMMTSAFAGILQKSSATVTNTGAKVWVMDPAVNNVLSSIPMPDYVLNAVRSTPGVRYAVPLYSGAGLIRLADGTYQAATVIGLDDTSLFGRPRMIEGNALDLYAGDGVIVVKDAEYDKLGRPALGATFEINDRRAVVVGLATTPASGLFGLPTLYTTYSRATEYVPSARFTISYVLVEPTGAALDGETGRKIVAFVKSDVLTDKRCILIVTHDDRILEYADRVMKMEDGRIIGIEERAHA